MGLTLFCTAGVTYLLSVLFHLITLYKKKDYFYRLAIGLLTVGFVLQLGSFAYKWASQYEVILSHFFDTLFFASLVLIGAYLFVSIRYRLVVLGMFVIPAALMLMYFTKVMPIEMNFTQHFRGGWLWLHVSMAIIGQMLLGIASIVALFYVIQERRLKNRSFSNRIALPALEVLDKVHFRALISGFSALSVGILIGAVWASQIWGQEWLWESKQLWTFLGWLIYGLILQGRMMTGLRGRRAAIYSLIGILLILFNLFGVTFLFPGKHGFI